MTEYTYGLNLELKGYGDFLRQAGEIDRTFAGLATTVQKAADDLSKINFGNFNIDLSSVTSINTKTIGAKATALGKLSVALDSLGVASNKLNSNAIREINAAIGSGAQVKTITGKATALATFAKQAEKVASLGNLAQKATEIKLLLDAFSGAQSLSKFTGFATIAKEVAVLINAFQKLGKSPIDPNAVKSIQTFLDVVQKLAGPMVQRLLTFIPDLATGFRALGDAFKSFSSGKGSTNLAGTLDAVSRSITTLVTLVQSLNKSSGGLFSAFNKTTGMEATVQQIKTLSGAFKELGKGIQAFGDSKNSTGVANLEADIQKVVSAFRILVSEFKRNNFSASLSANVQPAIELLKSLAGAFSSLGRTKGLQTFPATMIAINEAIRVLNVSGLNELANKIRTAIPALQQLAQVASAITKINTQSARSFVQAAEAKERDSNASRILAGATGALSAAISGMLPIIRSLIPSFSSIISGITTLGRTIASVSFAALQGGLNALRAIFISFPAKVLETAFNGVISAVRLFGSVVVGIISGVTNFVNFIRQLNNDFKILQTLVNAVVAPFKLLLTVLSGILSVISGVAGGFSKLVSAINPFAKTVGDSTRSLKENYAIQSTMSGAVNNTGRAAQQATNDFSRYSGVVDGASRSASNAAGGFNALSSAMDFKGASPLSNLLSMNAALSSLDLLARAAGSGLGVLKNTLSTLVGEGFNAAASFQSLQRSISVMLGQEQRALNPGMYDDALQAADAMSGKADQLLEKFQLLAIASPFATKDIADGFRLAQVFGFSTEEAEKLTYALTDTAAGMNKAGYEIADIILPLGQMKQVGKVLTQDLRQLAVRGIPVWRILSKEFGVTEAALAEMITEGTLPAKDGFNAAERAVNAIVTTLGGEFKNAAASATGSLSGLLNAAKELKEASLRDFFTPIFEAVLFGQKEGDFALADMLSLENIQGSIAIAKQYGQAVAINIGNAFQNVVLVIRAFIATLQSIPAPIQAIIGNAIKFGAIFAGVTLAIITLSAAATGLIALFGLFINPFTLLSAAVSAAGVVIFTNVGTIKTAFADLQTSFGQIPAFVNAAATALGTFFTTGQTNSSAFDGLSVTLRTIGQTMLSVVSIAQDFGNAFSNAFTTLVTTGTASVEAFSSLPTVFRVIGEELFGAINTFTSFGETISNIPILINGVSTTIGTTFKTLLADFVEFGANIIQSFADGISGTVDLIGQAVQAVGDVLTFWLAPGSPPRVAPDLDTWGALAAMEFVTSFTDRFIEALSTSGAAISDHFGVTFGDIGNAIFDVFAGIGTIAVTFIVGTFTNILASLRTIGTGIIEIIAALAMGVGSQVAIIIQALINIVEVLAQPTQAFETWSGVADVVTRAVSQSFFNLSTTLQGIFSGILTILMGVISFVNNEFLVGFQSISAVSEYAEEALGNISSGAADFLSGVETALQAAEDAFANTLDNVAGYGANVVELFADGILDTVSYVVDALQTLGSEIAYWLAPGSPPRILPDIDQWGTDAANEFLGGFDKADFDTIGDFGGTLADLLQSQEVEGVDVKKIVQEFSAGLADVNAGGDFGAGNLSNIQSLAGEAGSEVAVLTTKYIELAKEQAALNQVTKQYNEELEAAQGSLDSIVNAENAEANQKKVEALQNALGNTLLSNTERTRIQTEIQKIQAKEKVTQLEQEVKAQEKNVTGAQEALELQKAQLSLSDKFDEKGGPAASAADALSSSVSKAKTATDKLGAAQLKQALAAATTSEKIAILRGELAKMDEGTVEYAETMTQIIKLEQQLTREQEAAAKKEEAAAKKAAGAADSAAKKAEAQAKRDAADAKKVYDAELDLRLAKADTATQITILREELAKTVVGSVEYYKILKQIDAAEKKLAKEQKGGGADGTGGGGLFGGLTTGAANAQTSITETATKINERVEGMKTQITERFNEIRENINNVVLTVSGYIDTWILKNDLVKASLIAIGSVIAGVKIAGGIASIGSSLALLSNPLVLVSAAVVGLVAAFGIFSSQAGGVQGALDAITAKFRAFRDAFLLGLSGGEASFDTSTFDGIVGNIGVQLGNIAGQVQTTVQTFFSNIGTHFQNGANWLVTNVPAFFTTAWTTLQTTIAAVFTDITGSEGLFATAADAFRASVYGQFFQPVIDAFSGGDTVIASIREAVTAFYGQVTALLSGEFTATSNSGGIVDSMFNSSQIASEFETNANEAVAEIVPMMAGKFDLSDTITAIGNKLKEDFGSFSGIADTVSAAFDAIGQAYNTFVAYFTGDDAGGLLTNILGENALAFQEMSTEVTSPEFISGLTNIATLVGGVAAGFATLVGVLVSSALPAIMRNIADIVIEVGAGIGTLYEAFDLFQKGDIIGGFGKAFQGVSQILEGVFGNISDIISDTVKNLLEFFNIDTTGALGAVIDFISDMIVSFFSFRLGVGLAAKAIQAARSAFLGFFGVAAIGKATTETIQKGFTSLISFYLSIGSSVLSARDEVKGGFEAINEAANTLITNVQAAITKWATGITESLAGIQTKISEFVGGLAEAFIGDGTEMVVAGGTMVLNFFSAFMDGIGPGTTLAGNSFTSKLGLLDLSTVASALGSAFMAAFGIDSDEAIESIRTKLSTTITSAIEGITALTLNLAEKIIVSEDEVKALSDTIKGYMPDLDTLFGSGTTDKVSLKIADFITVDETEVAAIKQIFQDVVDVLNKFGTITGIPEAFNTSIQAVKDLFAGDATFATTLNTVWTALTGIVTALLTELTNPFGPIAEAIGNLATPIGTVSEAFVGIKTSIEQLLTIDLSGFSTVFKPITDAFASVNEGIAKFSGGIEAVTGINIGGATVSGQEEVQQKIQAAVQGSATPLTVDQKLEVVTDDANIAEQSKKLLDTFLASYEANTNAIGGVNFGQVNADMIEAGFTSADIEGLATKFGMQVPAGIAAGMNDTSSNPLTRDARALASNLLLEIASELDIQSPSGKARDDIGIPFVQGIAVGLQDHAEIIAATEAIATAMFETVSGVLNSVAETIDIAKSLFALNESSVNVTTQSLDQILTLHVDTFEEIAGSLMPDFVDDMTEMFEAMFEDIMDAADSFIADFLSALRTMSTDAMSILNDLLRKISELETKFGEAGTKLGEALGDGIIEAIEEKKADVVTAVESIFGADGLGGTALLEKATKIGFALGENITEGIAEGIFAEGAVNAVVDEIKRLLDEIQTEAKAHVGIESPSTVFRDTVGKFITAGIGVGIIEGMDGLLESTRTVMSNVTEVARGEIGSNFVSGIINGITGQQGNLNTTVASVMASSVLAAKTELDINSPSEVTKNMIGIPYIDGIRVALEGGKDSLTNVAGSLLNVLPDGKEFSYSVNGVVKEQPIDLKYNNLLTSLPGLSQNVLLQQKNALKLSGMTMPVNYQASKAINHMNNAASTMVEPFALMKNAMSQQISTMNNSRTSTVANNNTYNYTMHLTTTPQVAARASRNFDMMRAERSI